MTTFFLTHDHDSYQVDAIGLSILILKRNRKLIKFSDCPEDVQETIVERLTDNVVKDTANPYFKF